MGINETAFRRNGTTELLFRWRFNKLTNKSEDLRAYISYTNCIFLIAEIYDFNNQDNKIWYIKNNADSYFTKIKSVKKCYYFMIKRLRRKIVKIHAIIKKYLNSLNYHRIYRWIDNFD